MKKRIAFLILMVLFLLIGVLSINEIKVEAHEKSEEDMFVIQAEACSANEKLYESFEWCETYIYPQSFAGTFIDYDTLHVLVTDKSAMNYYIEILSGYQCVEYDIVDYSYNELYTDIERTAESLPEEIEIVSYGVDIVKNKAFICVMQDSFAVAKSYIKNNNILVEVSENKIIDETDVIGGATISCSGYSMTLAGSGTYSNSTAFLTCGHSISSGASVTAASNTIGTISLLQYTNNQYGDYSIASASSGYTSTSLVYATDGYTIAYTGYLTNPAVGTYLYKYGKESHQAYCKVERTGITVAPSSSMTIKGMTECSIVTGASTNGDSGGPYRSGTQFCGVHHGSSVRDGIAYVYFTPYVYPKNKGFSIKTN